MAQRGCNSCARQDPAVWSKPEINERLERLLVQAYREVAATAGEHGTNLRMAVLIRAIQRVAEAVMILGIFP
ncbi:MAG: hypothetical protein HY359_08850 [Candidatus Rokubacteria bacterium]|nr:hypothetical protein [Candidatus Rokubacteria bacterium]